MNHDQPYWIEPLNGAPCIHAQRGRLCSMEAGYQQTREADARDVCARLNALAGLNPDAVAGVVAALEACITEEDAHCLQHQETPGAMARRLRAINEHARAALAALRAPRTVEAAPAE